MPKSVRGPRGRVGSKGDRGERGPAGPAGPPGPKMKAAEVLALVDEQFAEIRKQFDIQLQRTAQLQMQLDRIQRNTDQACEALDAIQPLIRDLIKHL